MARARYDDEYDDRYEDDRYDQYEGDYGGASRGAPPPNYLTPAILTTLFCCTVFGIIAIVYAAQVNSKWHGGDYRGAREASGNAKMWCWLSFGIGLPLVILYVVANVFVAMEDMK